MNHVPIVGGRARSAPALDFNTPPPVPDWEPLPFILPVAGRVTRFAPCSALHSCEVHYWKGRTQPCFGPGGACPACPWPKRWQGWIAGYALETQAFRAVMQVSRSCAQLAPCLRLPLDRLLGRIMLFGRAGTKDNSRQWARLSDEQYPAAKRAVKFNLPLTLARTWLGKPAAIDAAFASALSSLVAQIKESEFPND